MTPEHPVKLRRRAAEEWTRSEADSDKAQAALGLANAVERRPRGA